MCGIAGIVGADVDAYRVAVDRMTAALRHRGPDDRGVAQLDGCVLGHTRLAIVDIEGGAQPMVAAGGSSAITFNGEIYGYREIRKTLADYPFRSTSDTEVVLALFERHGVGFVDHLPGMFALAIWDASRQALICARDRFGEKPFYYAFGSRGELVFASEIKALVASGLVVPVLAPSEVARYLARLYVHPHRTIYSNVHVLRPGHLLVFEHGQVRTHRYWSPPETHHAIEMDAAVEQFRALLEAAVKRQLIADVPVGAFLSGGLDSSTIVLAARHSSRRLKTFFFDFEGNHSEAAYAQAIAHAAGTEHVELRAASIDVSDLLQRTSVVYDEPFADSSSVPTFVLSALAREHVKCVLTGDGGDELLAGYDWYRPLYWMGMAGRSAVRWNLARIASRVARTFRLPGAQGAEAYARGLGYRLRHSDLLAAQRHESWWFRPDEIAEFGLPLSTDPEWLSIGAAANGHACLDDAMRVDIADYMVGDILTKIDRASMAHGLELRAPFLDVEFASFCMSLPYRLKINGDEDKIVFRRAYEQEWPAAVRRRRKQGFGAPLSRWLQQQSVANLIHDVLGNRRSRLFDFLPFEAVQRHRASNGQHTWSLLTLGLWAEAHDFALP